MRQGHRLDHPEVGAFQEAHLARLKAMSFAELSAMPRSRRMATPTALGRLEFWVERRVGEFGGIRIEVRACRRRLLVLLSCACLGFEMLPDGSVILDVDKVAED